MKREESEDSRRGMKILINDENLAKAEEDIAALRQMLGMNTMQVLIMTAVVALSSRSRFEGDDLARYLGMEYLKLFIVGPPDFFVLYVYYTAHDLQTQQAEGKIEN